MWMQMRIMPAHRVGNGLRSMPASHAKLARKTDPCVEPVLVRKTSTLKIKVPMFRRAPEGLWKIVMRQHRPGVQ